MRQKNIEGRWGQSGRLFLTLSFNLSFNLSFKLSLFFFLSFSLSSQKSWGAQLPQPEIRVRSTFALGMDDLETEQVWKFDPRLKNPHRRRWALDRKVKFEDFRILRKLKGKTPSYSISLRGLEMATVLYLRPHSSESKWFAPLSKFPCGSHGDENWFSTYEGSKKAGEAAAKVWEKLVTERKSQLELGLSQIQSRSSERADLAGRLVYLKWLKSTEDQWRQRVLLESRPREWKQYTAQVQKMGICKKQRTPASTPPWEEIMESPQGKVAKAPLSRLPVKLLNGIFTVRAAIEVGSVELNGRFILDPSAPKSLISPTFLQNQGVNPEWVTLPGRGLESAIWSLGQGDKIGRPVQVSGMVLSGLRTSLTRFLMVETQQFDSTGLTVCCDGVLGVDFLKQHAVEFNGGKTPHVNLWARKGFRMAEKTPWAEIYETPESTLVSRCDIYPGKSNDASRAGIGLLRWDLGRELNLAVAQPLPKTGRRLASKEGWSLVCGQEKIRSQVWSLPHGVYKKSLENGKTKSFQAIQVHTDLFEKQGADRTPGAAAGADFISGRSLLFDLSHGRVWFPPLDRM